MDFETPAAKPVYVMRADFSHSVPDHHFRHIHEFAALAHQQIDESVLASPISRLEVFGEAPDREQRLAPYDDRTNQYRPGPAGEHFIARRRMIATRLDIVRVANLGRLVHLHPIVEYRHASRIF